MVDTAFRTAERAYRRRDPSARGAAAAESAQRASLIDFGAALDARDAPPHADSAQAADAPLDAPLSLGAGRFTLRGHHPGLQVIPRCFGAAEQIQLAALALRRWPYRPLGITNLGELDAPEPARGGACGDKACVPVPTYAGLPPAQLSWMTLGYHYDWNSRSYDCNSAAPASGGRAAAAASPLPRRGPMPPLLAEHCARLVPGFAAEAAIVKLYDERGCMLAHVDDAERARDAPVISISLGCEAVFLLGGLDRETGPVLPILLRSGDALLLGGRARLCYHGLARVFARTAPDHFALGAPPRAPARAPDSAAAGNGGGAADAATQPGAEIDADAGLSRTRRAPSGGCAPCAEVELSLRLNILEWEWLRTHRININVRQVRALTSP
ncbi:hypothetical protein KFE25_011326 [Diacronema lutheri]|uniref:Alpha-ketoglutarate-dependent dioxygenase AlkB-like domain-containing protein n=1 Tax=Diacronema lutheri TaxID=2081491 RepID=A0A8J5X6W0_DIALT|nr:hypothetical protein KFE25_011326 [Diacronema lutheri]